MSTAFTPHNELERNLVAAQEGQLDPEAFIRILLDSEVFMPIYERHQIQGLQMDAKAKPLRIADESGAEVLVLFTSPERAKGFVSDFPGYGGGLVIEFSWILEKLGIGYGIALNPGLPVGMDFEAQDVAQMALIGARPH